MSTIFVEILWCLTTFPKDRWLCIGRFIKMSSPNMNNIIIVGCILCYLSIVLLGTDGSIASSSPVVFRYWCRVSTALSHLPHFSLAIIKTSFSGCNFTMDVF